MRIFREAVYWVDYINGRIDDLNWNLNENLGKLNEATGRGLIFGNRAIVCMRFIRDVYNGIRYIVKDCKTQSGHAGNLHTAPVCN